MYCDIIYYGMMAYNNAIVIESCIIYIYLYIYLYICISIWACAIIIGPDFRWRGPGVGCCLFELNSEPYTCKRSQRGLNYGYKD